MLSTPNIGHNPPKFFGAGYLPCGALPSPSSLAASLHLFVLRLSAFVCTRLARPLFLFLASSSLVSSPSSLPPPLPIPHRLPFRTLPPLVLPPLVVVPFLPLPFIIPTSFLSLPPHPPSSLALLLPLLGAVSRSPFPSPFRRCFASRHPSPHLHPINSFQARLPSAWPRERASAVYLSNIHPQPSTEVLRFDPRECAAEREFIPFIDPATAFTLGWGKNSGPLPPTLALAVHAGATRNVYIGNVED
ncbi:hypothetical protein C8J57DRAFT_1707185 [Mycena rebaudengoi]|nr:hypothetical protein C8J57DRAFT_1707185 [Mycena rebaudengoi]